MVASSPPPDSSPRDNFSKPPPLGEEPAAAKVNLYLHVLGRRDDGYHALESLVGFTDLADRLEAYSAAAWELALSGPEAAHVPPSDDNLVLQAVRMMLQEVVDPLSRGSSGRDPLSRGPLGADQLELIPGVSPLKFVLEKNIPVEAGLGGGSGDAAAALRLIERLWPPPLKAKMRMMLASELASRLGADVPVCLRGRPSLVSGLGDVIRPSPMPDLPIVLVNPRVRLPTAQVFALWSRLNGQHPSGASFMDAPLAGGLLAGEHAKGELVTGKPLMREPLEGVDLASQHVKRELSVSSGPLESEKLVDTPLMEEPLRGESLTGEPFTGEPVAGEPVIGGHARRELLTDKHLTREPLEGVDLADQHVKRELSVSSGPLESEKLIDTPLIEDPLREESLTGEPAAGEPVAGEPVAGEPVKRDYLPEEHLNRDYLPDEHQKRECLADDPSKSDSLAREHARRKSYISAYLNGSRSRREHLKGLYWESEHVKLAHLKGEYFTSQHALSESLMGEPPKVTPPPLDRDNDNPAPRFLDLSVHQALTSSSSRLSSPRALMPIEMFIEWLGHQRNDLEWAAQQIVPDIKTVLDLFASTPDCLLARMSGSGATCFGVFPHKQAAHAAARYLTRIKPQWWICATCITGSSAMLSDSSSSAIAAASAASAAL